MIPSPSPDVVPSHVAIALRSPGMESPQIVLREVMPTPRLSVEADTTSGTQTGAAQHMTIAALDERVAYIEALMDDHKHKAEKAREAADAMRATAAELDRQAADWDSEAAFLEEEHQDLMDILNEVIV